jgi:asparagine synthase (glutamine-hydrolysing)
MCGIAGVYSGSNDQSKLSSIKGMTDCLKHRGPNAEGIYQDKNIALGHRRLSIIDLSEIANQPMSDPSGRYTIIFNGEIYNYQEIRKTIIDYEFKTNGDTEVILASYIQNGEKCLEALAGMFAFAIWDTEKQELFIARDRIGVKPVYYFQKNDLFLFGSEIRSLLNSGFVPKKLDRDGLYQYLMFQSVPAPFSIVEGVKQLKAGSWIRITSSGIVEKEYWWTSRSKVEFDFNDESKVHKEINRLMVQSIERRMVSDVPVGAFLSGGIDSSIVVGLMAQVSSNPVYTFTMGYKEKEFDESEYAQIVANRFNTNHNFIKVSPSSFLNEFETALSSMDIPSGDGVNSYVVSKKIKESNISVALSGIGGDELFCGYPIFTQVSKLMKYKGLFNSSSFVRKRLPGALVKNKKQKQLLDLPKLDVRSVYPLYRQIFSDKEIKALLKGIDATPSIISDDHDWSGFPLLSQISMAELNGYTQHTLLKDTDQMSMAVALEIREPFFDHQLIEFVLSIPDNIKYPTYPKKLLIEAFKGILPDEIIHRKKQGFLMPWEPWLRKELKSFAEARIQRVSERDLFDKNAIFALWNKFQKGDSSVKWIEIWLLVVLEYWLEKNEFE